MKLQPFFAWWLIGPYLVAALALIGWQYKQIRRRDKPVKLRLIRRATLLLLPLLIAIGPSVQGGTSSPGVGNLDIYFAIDTTPSMGTLDYIDKQQRIEGVKADLQALAKTLQGAHMEIITFDTQANVVLPLTTDTTAFSTAVADLTPQINSYSQGSSVDKPISLLEQELKNSQDAYPDHFRLVFYLGDGEQTTEKAAKPFTALSRKVDGGAVLGYGTVKGARIIKYTGLDSKPLYVTTVDPTSRQLVPAISHMSPETLKSIASQIKVSFLNRNQGGPVNDIYQASKAPLAIDHSQHIVHYLNLYWLVAIPFAGLIFWEWQALIVKLFDLRDHRQGRGGRHAK